MFWRVYGEENGANVFELGRVSRPSSSYFRRKESRMFRSTLKAITILIFAAPIGLCSSKTLDLFTSTTGHGDSNWDVWQQDQGETVEEDAIYLGMFDGASGHSDYQPESPVDGNVDGMYSTMSMGPGGLLVNQSLGVSGTNPSEFPDDQRDTRVSALFNLAKFINLHSSSDDIKECKFKWSIDYVMPWAGSTTYLQAPMTLYIGIFAADKQEYWSSMLDGNDLPTTDINDLQDEFDPNSMGILYAEKEVDIRVDDGPWGAGIQPLTNWYIEQYGVQFYEVNVTEEVWEIISADPNKYADPNTAFLGFTIRASLDGESVYLSMDARDRLAQNPIPPTLQIMLTNADFNSDGIVNFYDFAVFAQSWRSSSTDDRWNAECNLDDSGSSENVIDTADLLFFCDKWLEGTI